MTIPAYNWFQAIPVAQFDPGTLSGTFQPIFTAGFSDSIKIMTVYNGGTVGIEVSFNGTDLHALWPAGATLVIDLQTNHADNSETGAGTLNGRKGQNVWVRTSTSDALLTVGGYR